MLLYILSRLGSIQYYPPRFGKLLYIKLLYILSRLCSICRGLASYAISCHALAVSAEVWQCWHAVLYPVAPWQNPLKDQPPKTQATKA